MKEFLITHGNQNDSIFLEEDLSELIGRCVEEGKEIFKDTSYDIKNPKSGEKEKGELNVLALKYNKIDNLLFIQKNKDRENFFVVSFYPVIKGGTEIELTIDEIYEDPGTFFEGTLETNYKGRTIFFFDPYYFKNKDKYKIGEKYKFQLSGFLYFFRDLEDDEKEIEVDWDEETREALGYELEYDEDGNLKPIILKTDQMNSFMPSEEFLGDYEFQSKIKYCNIFDHNGTEMVNLGLEFLFSAGVIGEDKDEIIEFDAYIRADKINKNDIVIGKSVKGIVYFQGTLVE